MPECRKSSAFKAAVFMMSALGPVYGLHAAGAPAAATPPHRGVASSIDVPTLDGAGNARRPPAAPASATAAATTAAAAASAASAPASAAAPMQPIDTKAVARKFRPGRFKTRMVMIGPSGRPGQESDTLCMTPGMAETVVAGVMDGLAGCDVQSSENGKSSIAVSATCPALGPFGPNFYTGVLHWSTDGKQIDMESKRVALDQGQPTKKALQVIRYKLSYDAPTCQP